MWVAGGLREASRNPHELPNSPVTIVIHLGSVFSLREASTVAQGRLGDTWKTIRVSAKKRNTSSNILLLKKIRVYIVGWKMFWGRRMIRIMFEHCFMIDESISGTSASIKLDFSGSDQMPLNTLVVVPLRGSLL